MTAAMLFAVLGGVASVISGFCDDGGLVNTARKLELVGWGAIGIAALCLVIGMFGAGTLVLENLR